MAAVRTAAISGLKGGGHEVDLLDLDREGFEPRLYVTRARSGMPTDQVSPPSRTTCVPTHPVAARRGVGAGLPDMVGGQPAIMKGWLGPGLVEGVAFTPPEGGGRVRPQLTNIRFLVAR